MPHAGPAGQAPLSPLPRRPHVQLVNRAGEALSTIVESVKDVAALVSDIAQASTEQATGLEQINKALTQMDEATQQNAAIVEENAATAKSLETQAQSMDEQVAFFKLDADASEPLSENAKSGKPIPISSAARSAATGFDAGGEHNARSRAA